jgi:short-subunit dehydrogenase
MRLAVGGAVAARSDRAAALVRPLLRAVGRRVARPPSDEELRRAVGGRVVLITGASRGIDAEVAAACGHAGAHVLLVARTRERLEAVATGIRDGGGRASVYPCDLSDLDAVTRLTEDILQAHGRVDVLVNNAAHSIRRTVVETAPAGSDAERLATLNYLAAVRLMLAFAPGMAQHGDGHIVQVSTVATLAHAPRFAAYLASKTALEEYGRVLAAELRHRGVDVSVVHLPLVRTEMIAPTTEYRGLPSFSPEQGAAFVLRALARRPVAVALGLHGPLHLVDGMAPGLLRRAVSRLAPRNGR